MKNNKTKLSIIVPIYNGEQYISECLNSILYSKKDSFEVIIVNDGSTDNSLTICKEYLEKDNRIKLINQNNYGVSCSRNKGIEQAVGKYIMFVDCDDILDNNWDNILENDLKKDIYYITNRLKKNLCKDEVLQYITGYNKSYFTFAAPFSKIFKTSFIKSNRIKFKENLINGEDMIFNIEALLKASDFEIINMHIYKYRVFQGSSTKRFDNKIFSSDQVFHKELSLIFKRYELDESLKEKISIYLIQMAIIVILNRIVYVNSFKKAKVLMKNLKTTPYIDCMRGKMLVQNKYKIVIWGFNKNLYFLIYLFFRIILLLKCKFKKDFEYVNI